MAIKARVILANRLIESLDRLNCSVYGNPRYRVHFTDGSSAITMSDAGFVYAINNPEYRNAELLVEFTRAGRIRHMEPANVRGCSCGMADAGTPGHDD